MILRLIMMVIRPSDTLLKKRKLNRFNSYRVWWYQYILKLLLKSYSHYAVCDVIEIPDIGVTLRHEFRDLEFESELRRNKILFLPKLENVVLPLTLKKSKRRSNFSYFKFVDKLSFSINGKNLCISHDDVLSINCGISNKFKCNRNVGGLASSYIEIINSRMKPKPSSDIKEVVSETSVKVPMTGLFDKEKEVVKKVDAQDKSNVKTLTIGKVGFDIDTTF